MTDRLTFSASVRVRAAAADAKERVTKERERA
jgi:hypothetical protein